MAKYLLSYDHRRQELLANGPITVDEDPEEIGIRSKQAFLDILLRTSIDGKPLSDLDIRQEMDTFMFEVSDGLMV